MKSVVRGMGRIGFRNVVTGCVLGILGVLGSEAVAAEKPWKHGDLQVSANQRYLVHEDGTPFFWLGDTGWLLPERLDRDEAAFYLRRTYRCRL